MILVGCVRRLFFMRGYYLETYRRRNAPILVKFLPDPLLDKDRILTHFAGRSPFITFLTRLNPKSQ